MKKILFLLFLSYYSTPCFAQVEVQDLRTENLSNPIGLDIAQPRFSWQLKSDKNNVTQTAYEVKVLLKKEDIWNSGKTISDQSLFIPYEGKALASGKKYSWQVRIWDEREQVSEWSSLATFQMAFLNQNDWKAKWIEPGFEEEKMRPSPLFRKDFDNRKEIVSATAYITAHGLYEAQINGKRIGDGYLTPGWTSYKKRLQYQVYDVTQLLQKGKNAIGVRLGNGWWRGDFTSQHKPNTYGKDIALLFQLEIEYANGETQRIISDGSWKSATGAIRSSEIYAGEIIDARLEKTGWTLPGYDDSNWENTTVSDHPMDVLLATYNEPIKKQEVFQPIAILTTPKGERVLDFGQNLVGWVEVKARGQAGDKIVLSHAEVLDKDGNFYTENIRAAKQQNTYILDGKGKEVFEPHFSWQGFRYVRVDEYPGDLKAYNFKAIALYSDMKPTGQFTSSNPLINQLQHNIQWGQKGNFLDVPTDCPQRDERLGWTGDAQAFSRTAAFNFDVYNFFSKWLKDLIADQDSDGRVPYVIPHVLNERSKGSAGWADAATIIPWNMYLLYGDKKILQDQYESMKAWVTYMENNSTHFLWNKGFHFGDWMFYRPADDTDGTSAVTDKYLIAQCFFAHSTQLLLNTAHILNKEEDIAKYSSLLNNIKKAFLQEYVTPSGRLVSGTQTAYVLALDFDMLPESLRPGAVNRLVENIRRYKNHLTTGFLGTPNLCFVLSRFGQTEVAYELLLQETYPSWLYPVKKGATTIWERWDGIKPDGSFQNPNVNSFNHYAYGAIGDWMYRVVAGIDLDEDAVGYKKIKIKPHIGGGFTHASAKLNTLYGKVSSSWKIEKEMLVFDVEIPANTTATIYVPVKENEEVEENGKALLDLKTVEDGYIILKRGSGKFRYKTTQN